MSILTWQTLLEHRERAVLRSSGHSVAPFRQPLDINRANLVHVPKPSFVESARVR